MTQTEKLKKVSPKHWIIVTIILCFTLAFFALLNPILIEHQTASRLLNDSIIRLLSVMIFIMFLLNIGYKNIFRFKISSYVFLSTIVPGLLIAGINFPFSAYIKGLFHQSEPTYIVFLFIVASIITASLEEIVFRGIILLLLLQNLPNTKKSIIMSIILSSILFGLVHAINIGNGLSLYDGVLQIGYSTLMGIMWAVVFIKTRSIWYPIILHALYNVSGQILHILGNIEMRYDLITIITMTVVSVLVGVWILYLLLQLTHADVDSDLTK